MSATTLSSLPHFTFYQDLVAEESEQPINVTYYDGTIELEQEGNEIRLQPAHVRALMKEIIKNLPEAERLLAKR